MAVSSWSLLLTILCLDGPMTLGITTEPCPEYSAMFTVALDTVMEGSRVSEADPELTFFKEVLGFRDDDIQNTFKSAVQYFNDTFGLDFSLSPPNDQNEVVFENARMTPTKLMDDVNFKVVFNNWVLSGNTRSTCSKLNFGRYFVTFSADQMLHGSYGGKDGKPVGVENYLLYGYYVINVCAQSPLIIQYQTAYPTRTEPVDGHLTLNVDTYNNVLGHGKAYGVLLLTPVPDEPEKNVFAYREVFSFPAN